jgi:transposase-like protein
MSLTAFDRKFPDDSACARHLLTHRWPEGFVCPRCDGRKGWELRAKRFTWECAKCHHQSSVTAGTVMHRSHLPLRTWFQAIRLLTCHSNGLSAEQAQAQLGLGSYKTAWLLLQKLRRAMVDPDRVKLDGIVEVDETEVPLRSKRDPIAGHGIPNVGKLLIIGAVELTDDGKPKRLRLEPLADKAGETVRAFVGRTVERGSRVITDGLPGYRALAGFKHVGKTVGSMAGHVLLPWIHRAFSNLKRWLMGTLHGVRKPHLKRYLDEFVFRWNRRRSTASAFDSLLRLATCLDHASERDFVLQRA